MTLVATFLGIASAAFAPWLASLFALVGAVGIVLWIKDLAGARADPYSLEALRRQEEREELHRLLEDEPGIAVEADVVCPGCMEPYSPRLRACPRCKNG